MPTTFNTTDPKPGYVYDAATDTWFPLLGIAPGSSVVRWRKTVSGGETSVSGLDDLGATLSYNAGTEQVYLNGVLLVRTEDYTATNGTSVTGLTALAASDVIEVISFNATNVQITDALLETDINAKGDLIVGAAVDTATILASGTNGQVLKVNTATTSGLEWAADSTYAAPTIGSTSIASGATVTTIAGLTLTSPTATSPTFTGTTKIAQILETTTLSTSAVTATQNYDVITNGAVTYVTASNTSNYTLNVRGDGSTTLNSIMSTGQALTIAHLVTNGGTAYYLTQLQIDGTTSGVTTEWQGGTAPSSGNTNSVDIYSITIIKTGSATFTAFAAQTKFA
jgi:hypothetical protein